MARSCLANISGPVLSPPPETCVGSAGGSSGDVEDRGEVHPFGALNGADLDRTDLAAIARFQRDRRKPAQRRTLRFVSCQQLRYLPTPGHHQLVTRAAGRDVEERSFALLGFGSFLHGHIAHTLL